MEQEPVEETLAPTEQEIAEPVLEQVSHEIALANKEARLAKMAANKNSIGEAVQARVRERVSEPPNVEEGAVVATVGAPQCG